MNSGKSVDGTGDTLQGQKVHGRIAASPALSWLGVPRFGWSLTLVGLCTFTFAIVSYKFPVGDVGIAMAVVGLVLQRDRIRLPFPVWIYSGFVLWALIASFASNYPDIARERIVDSLKLLAIIIVIVNALRTEGQLRFYLLFFLGCFILFPVRGTLVGGDTLYDRAVWNYIYNNPNDLAALCLIALGVALGFLFARPSPLYVRLGGLASSLFLLLVILLTQSRGAFIGLLVGLGPAMLVYGIRRPIRAFLVAGSLALIGSLVIPPGVWERLSGIEKLTSTSTLAEADVEGSASERFEIQKTGWQIFIDHPIFGTGLGTYPLANAEYSPQLGKRDTHNTYLNLASELGVPGLALWLACFGSVLIYAFKMRMHSVSSALWIQQRWLERAFLAYLVAAAVGTYSKLTFPYLILAAIWCSANLLAGERTMKKDSN